MRKYRRLMEPNWVEGIPIHDEASVQARDAGQAVLEEFGIDYA